MSAIAYKTFHFSIINMQYVWLLKGPCGLHYMYYMNSTDNGGRTLMEATFVEYILILYLFFFVVETVSSQELGSITWKFKG